MLVENRQADVGQQREQDAALRVWVWVSSPSPGLGMIRSRTGSGRNEPDISWARRSIRNLAAPTVSSIVTTAMPSTPGVCAPVFELTISYPHLTPNPFSASAATCDAASPKLSACFCGRIRVSMSTPSRGERQSEMSTRNVLCWTEIPWISMVRCALRCDVAHCVLSQTFVRVRGSDKPSGRRN